MKKDNVKTKRLRIEPMSDEETEDLIRHSDSEEFLQKRIESGRL